MNRHFKHGASLVYGDSGQADTPMSAGDPGHDDDPFGWAVFTELTVVVRESHRGTSSSSLHEFRGLRQSAVQP